MKSVPAIGFDYRPSRLIAVAIVAVLTCAGIAIAVCGLPVGSKVLLAIASCGYGVWSLRDFLQPRCRHLHWHEAGHWRVRDAQEQEHLFELHNAVMLGSLIALSLRSKAIGRTSVLLLPDNCDADTRRHLRVRVARTKGDSVA
jgi:toxin CptA